MSKKHRDGIILNKPSPDGIGTGTGDAANGVTATADPTTTEYGADALAAARETTAEQAGLSPSGGQLGTPAALAAAAGGKAKRPRNPAERPYYVLQASVGCNCNGLRSDAGLPVHLSTCPAKDGLQWEEIATAETRGRAEKSFPQMVKATKRFYAAYRCCRVKPVLDIAGV